MKLTTEEIEELKGLAASMGLYDDKNPCKRAVILGKAIKALEEREPGEWNRITKCPMDADERAYWSEQLGYEIPDDEAYMYGNLPKEGEDVLVCTALGTIFIDSLCCDEWCYFEEYGEMDGIVAWMPLPKPYKEVEE